MSETEKVFAAGVFFKAPREGAPEFIKGSLSFKVDEAIAFLQAHVNVAGYVNCDVKESKGGKLYVELNTWKPEKPAGLAEEDENAANAEAAGSDEINPDDIPF